MRCAPVDNSAQQTSVGTCVSIFLGSTTHNTDLVNDDACLVHGRCALVAPGDWSSTLVDRCVPSPPGGSSGGCSSSVVMRDISSPTPGEPWDGCSSALMMHDDPTLPGGPADGC